MNSGGERKDNEDLYQIALLIDQVYIYIYVIIIKIYKSILLL
jgi:hypothetical protein